jgi:hypothetical protein
MQPKRRQLLRLALTIHRAGAQPPKPALATLPEEVWRNCHALRGRLAKTEHQRWPGAAREVRRQLTSALAVLGEDLSEQRAALNAPLPPAYASPHEIFQDLLALEQEFNELDWDRRAGTLTVTTEPITLEDVPLGRFAIELRWKSLSPLPRIGCYQVIALDPNPAEKDDDITHPHVQGGMLCEGEAHQAIRQALRQGRLLDFFSIVRQVLETYNSGSPFAALDEWFGSRCDDCDAWVAAGDVTGCYGCENALCDGCRLFCSGCDDCYCARCLSACAGCDQDYCSGCLRACARCGELTCANCLDSHHICEDCHANQDDESPSAEVQPDGLGQAAVSA